MHLVNCRVRHYRSIGDSGLVEFDPEITNIVGAAGSGKTSFLKMLSGVSDKVQFGEGDLPRNSEVLTRFHDGNVGADEIVQLEAAFQVEDTDAPLLPQEYRHARYIHVRRTFDGGIALAVDGTWVPRGVMHEAPRRSPSVENFDPKLKSGAPVLPDTRSDRKLRAARGGPAGRSSTNFELLANTSSRSRS